MKILIIGFNEVDVMPYITPYVKMAQKSGVEYEILEWNRKYDGEMTFDPSSNKWTISIKASNNKTGKLYSFYRWKKSVINFLKKNNYDKIVILTTFPGILLSKLLNKKYANKYIFDIRDYTYEYIPYFRYLEKKVMQSAKFNVISSKGFYQWLPQKDKTIVAHNITSYESLPKTKSKEDTRITIGYLGCISYLEENVALINGLDDKTFKMLYAGVYPETYNIKDYCVEEDIKNIEFLGKYNISEKNVIYQRVDLINAIYGNKSPIVKYALPNKLYDGLQLKIPILASKATYLGAIVEKYKVGISVDLQDAEFGKKIEKFMQEYSKEEFEKKCEILLRKVKKEQEKYLQNIEKFMRA